MRERGGSMMRRSKRWPFGLVVVFFITAMVLSHLMMLDFEMKTDVEERERTTEEPRVRTASSLLGFESEGNKSPQKRSSEDRLVEFVEQSNALEKAAHMQLDEKQQEVFEQEEEDNEEEEEEFGDSKEDRELASVILVLSSHGRLVLYDVKKDSYHTVEEGDGLYYGVFPGRSRGLVWVSKSKSVGPAPDELCLYNVTKQSGVVVRRTPVYTAYMHDTIASGDLSRVFAADVTGSVLSLLFIGGTPKETRGWPLNEFKRYPVFTKREHINTLAYSQAGTLWVMLHNIGPSKIVQLDLASGERICEIQDVGEQAHGLVFIEDESAFLILSSKAVSLVKVKIPADCVTKRVVQAEKETIWKYQPQTKHEKPKFLKGLAVVDDVAYFGISDLMTSREKRKTVDTSLVAYDLRAKRILWIRSQVGTKGLINVIAAPFYSPDSSYRHVPRSKVDDIPPSFSLAHLTWTKRGRAEEEEEEEEVVVVEAATTEGAGKGGAEDDTDAMVDEEGSNLDDSGEMVETGNHESKCSVDYLTSIFEYKKTGLPHGICIEDEDAFYQLPLKFDVGMMQKEADLLNERFGYTYRADVNNYFILLVTKNGELEEGLQGPFSPVPNRLSQTPYLRRVLDTLGVVVGRSRFMLLKKGEKVKRHTDNVQFRRRGKLSPASKPDYSHSYWGRRFRIHIPIYTHPNVTFGSGEQTVNMKAGYAYIFDNGNPHFVSNDSPIDRVHLIVDTIGTKRLFDLVRQGVIFKKDGREVGALKEIPVVPEAERDAKVMPLFENWQDVAPFKFNSADNLRPFFTESILPRIQDASLKERLSEIFNTFLGDWSATCGGARPNQDACDSLAKQLLEQVLDIAQCVEKPATLENASISIPDAVEAALRMSFFACEEPTLKDSVPEQDHPFLPIDGHPFRVPLCFRGKKTSAEKKTKETAKATQNHEPSDADNDGSSNEKAKGRDVETEDSKTCRRSFFNVLLESKRKGHAYGITAGKYSFYKLPLKFDVERMQQEAQWLNETYGYTFRADVNNYFILLATLHGQLEQGRQGPFAPVPNRLSQTPYLRRVVDALGIILGRSRFMMLKAGEKVKNHFDDVMFLQRKKRKDEPTYTHGYWGRRFRLHVPIFSHSKVIFGSGDAVVHMEPGYAYVFDNGNMHYVENNSPIDRVHFIMDTVGSPKLFRLMQEATVYMRDGTIVQGQPDEEVPFDKSLNTQLIFEDWQDPNAFDYMKTSALRDFIDTNLLPRIVEDSDREMLSSKLETFYDSWENSCASAKDPDHVACNGLLSELLYFAVSRFQCGPQGPVLLSDSHLSVAEVLEVLSRMTYFSCKGQGGSASLTTTVPEDQLMLPIPGHPFLVPPCARRGQPLDELPN